MHFSQIAVISENMKWEKPEISYLGSLQELTNMPSGEGDTKDFGFNDGEVFSGNPIGST